MSKILTWALKIIFGALLLCGLGIGMEFAVMVGVHDGILWAMHDTMQAHPAEQPPAEQQDRFGNVWR